MNKIILFSFFLTSVSMVGRSIEFEKIVKSDSSDTKEILFDRLNSRLIEHIGGQDKYDKNILQSDKETGVIKFKQVLEYDPKGNRSDDGYVNYNVNVYFKDGRFKIILSDLFHEGKGISLYEITKDDEYPHKKSNFLKFRNKAWKELKNYVNTQMPLRILIIEKLVTTPTEIEDDW